MSKRRSLLKKQGCYRRLVLRRSRPPNELRSDHSGRLMRVPLHEEEGWCMAVTRHMGNVPQINKLTFGSKKENKCLCCCVQAEVVQFVVANKKTPAAQLSCCCNQWVNDDDDGVNKLRGKPNRKLQPTAEI